MNINSAKKFGKDIVHFLETRWRIVLVSKPIRYVESYARSIVFPGFDGMSLYDVVGFFIRGIQRGAITSRASAFSFNFFLAVFPAIIFFFTIIPYIPISGFQDMLLELMRDFIPEKVYGTVEETLFDIVKRQHGGLLSIGFILAMYFSTNGINSLIESFNQTYHTIETRSAFKQRLISILLVLILSVLVIVAIVLMIVGPIVLEFLATSNILHNAFTVQLIIFGKWIVVAALFFFAFSFLYYLAPAKRKQFRFISAGSTLATLLTILTSIGFNYYANNFIRYNTLYGSIGTLMIVMLWIYFNAIIVLIGFELNASISKASNERRSAK
ncbi:MAG: YihY/virulence factor BrkB family protein [Bacteroidales bacterium]